MRILGVAGSIRTGSYNTALLEEAKTMLPAKATLTISDISNLPIYNRDLEMRPPEAVRTFKAEVRDAEALLFATPEHNRSISAALRNAIEWGNRSEDDDSWRRQTCRNH